MAEKPILLGIDLGTTNTCVAYVRNKIAKVVPSDRGALILPSVVAMSEKGDLLVGNVAKDQMVVNPRNTIYGAKRLIGRQYNSKAVQDIKGGKITFRVDKHSNLHLIIGKASFTEEQLVDNYAAALDEVLRAKPSAAKGKYLKKVTFATTMGPGVPVDPNVVKNLRSESAEA